MGCPRVVERAGAAMGMLEEAPARFEHARDVPGAGVLCALPALLAGGLLKYAGEMFSLPKGFYSVAQIFILMGFMALSRIKSMEQLRYCPPGEWGKALGLDRIPEVKTMRSKVKHMAETADVEQWGLRLSKDWMEADPESAGLLYVDGHIRVYHGRQTKLPARYAAREKLCLRGMTDYWVNDQTGRPFFVITTPLTHGLLAMMREEIIPRLLDDVPGQPSPEQLQADNLLHRFIVIFDREGYSPDFFKHLWQNRIACQTYHKYPGPDWPACEFDEYTTIAPHGHRIAMKLAERGVKLSNGMWVREIRKLTQTGHQTSVLSTDYKSPAPHIAVHMFSRWSQENFFRYMMNHYNIDALTDYSPQPVDETARVTNPHYRRLVSNIKSKAAKLSRKKAEFGEIILKAEKTDRKQLALYVHKKAELIQTINELETELGRLKDQRSKTPSHIQFKQLQEHEQFQQFSSKRKLLIDTVKMIAFRAESAIVSVIRQVTARPDDAYSLAREIFRTEADLIPDNTNNTLTIRLHHLSNPISDQAVLHLLKTLNESDSYYPGTNLRLVYDLVSNSILPDQES